MVSLKRWKELDGAKHPMYLDGARIFSRYKAARDAYMNYLHDGKKPVLIAMIDSVNNGVIDVKNKDLFNTNEHIELSKRDYSIQQGGMDYLTMALIDVGFGEEPVWLHAKGSFTEDNKKDARIYIMPINMLKDSRPALYIVFENAGRKGLKYKLSFELPEIPGNISAKSSRQIPLILT